MSVEYRAIVDAGFILQLDCPDLPMVAKPSAVSFEAANPRHEHEWETLAGQHWLTAPPRPAGGCGRAAR